MSTSLFDTPSALNQDASWLGEPEGQLSVDVIETPQEIIVRSAIAGVSGADLDITLAHDTLTIRGKRHTHHEEQGVIHVQECYWGSFSRSIILPCPVDGESVDAVLQNGILTVTLKKKHHSSHVSVIDLEDL
jgi:HSP20 family protein